MNIVEQGPSWANLCFLASNVAPSSRALLSAIENIVAGGLLSQFAIGANEMGFLSTNTIIPITAPVWLADSDGYNLGARILGLCNSSLLEGHL